MSAPTRTDTGAPSQPKGRFVRSVDALERLFYRYTERNPAHFCVVAEFDVTLTDSQVRVALLAVQLAHPLLSVHVDDHPGSRLGFYVADSVAPIDVTVHEDERRWQDVTAAELAHPFDRSTAPLMRAVLLNRRTGSTIVLTFDHTIADGISSTTVMNDLVNALNGNALAYRDVPPSVEDMIARTLAPTEIATSDDASDPRMAVPTSIRPFDGTRPCVNNVTLNIEDTARLVLRCRAEQTTVHAALLTAASRVHATLFDKEFVRVLSPINVRPLIDAAGDCADYFMCTITGMAPRDGTAFWDQAKAMTADLTIARSGPGAAAVSATIQQAIPIDAECVLTEQLFTRALPFDLLITNLGRQDLNIEGSIRPTTLWGPVVQSQADDFVIGVTTYDGRLRIISTGYTRSDVFLEYVRATLVRAAQPDHGWSADTPQ
jgi:NRPS condensation-like uncharacterized protein